MGNCFKRCRGGGSDADNAEAADDRDRNGNNVTDHDERRRAAAEAAERRNRESDQKGMKGQGGFSSKKARNDQKEAEMEARGGGPQGGGLKWQVN